MTVTLRLSKFEAWNGKDILNWLNFVFVFGLFFLTHSLPVRPVIKARLVRLLGARGFTLAYSALSVAMLGWLIVAASNAPYVALWDQAIWQRHVTFAGMLAVCLFLALAIGRPNPFSFGGVNNELFDPHHPGLIRWTRHPMLIILAGWSALHLLPNGDVAHVILFGSFAIFAISGMKIIDRRKQRLMGQAKWESLRREVASAPLISMQGSIGELFLRITAGIFIFVMLLTLHPVVLGVSPLP